MKIKSFPAGTLLHVHIYIYIFIYLFDGYKVVINKKE